MERTYFHGQHDMYCNTAAVLKVDLVHKQCKSYNPDVYVEECEYSDAERHGCSMSSDSDDDEGFFEVTWACALYI